jgi:hypothetical protein
MHHFKSSVVFNTEDVKRKIDFTSSQLTHQKAARRIRNQVKGLDFSMKSTSRCFFIYLIMIFYYFAQFT